MVVIDKNLEQLTNQFNICDSGLVDDFSLKIKLGPKIYRPLDINHRVLYGMTQEPSYLFGQCETVEQNVSIESGGRVLACSKDIYRIPLDYMGLVQTKGTLARLFVQATCNDGQVEPGFEGLITLEIVNLSPWTIDLPISSEVAQMYIMKCSSIAEKPYNGRYSLGAKEGPTLPIFKL
jgi:dCTP deaminase